MKDLKGRTAVVTGAGSGIGRSYALRAVQEGMNVVLADINPDALAAVEAELSAAGAPVLAVRTNVMKAEEVQALADQAAARFGGVHLVFNNAGVGSSGQLLWEKPLQDWEWVMGVNLWGMIHGMRSFTPLLLAQEEGHIVNMASIAGLIFSGLGIYSITKHAVVSLSEALYLDLQRVGARVGVSVVCPFWVRTNIMQSEQYRPADLQIEPRELSEVEKAANAALAETIANASSPDEIAELTFEAIRTERFYVVTHEMTMPLIADRMQTILQGGSPRLYE